MKKQIKSLFPLTIVLIIYGFLFYTRAESITLSCDEISEKCTYTTKKRLIDEPARSETFHIKSIYTLHKERRRSGHRDKLGSMKYYILFKNNFRKKTITKKIYNEFNPYYKNPKGNFYCKD
jgi:hypothetical protein